MGVNKIKREIFFAQHPICCFCGGNTKSEEPDHIPSRALFLNRQWPEGYLFPSCIKCNRTSRYYELVISFLSRLYPDPSTKEEEAEFNKSADSINKRFPEILKELMLSNVKKKRLAKKHNIDIPVGGTSKDIPIVSFNGKRTNDSLVQYEMSLKGGWYF